MGDHYTQGQVKHNGAWSPHTWVTVTCQALCPHQNFSVKFCAVSMKAFWMRLLTKVTCVHYIHAKNHTGIWLCMLKILWSLSEFSLLQMAEAGHYRWKDEEEGIDQHDPSLKLTFQFHFFLLPGHALNQPAKVANLTRMNVQLAG